MAAEDPVVKLKSKCTEKDLVRKAMIDDTGLRSGICNDSECIATDLMKSNYWRRTLIGIMQ